MGKAGKILGGIAVVLIGFLGVRVAIVRSFDEPLPPRLATVGQLPVKLPNGRSSVLAESIRPGLPTIVTLWASWCEPCQREAPKIAELRRRFGRDKLNLIYVNVRDEFASPQDRAAYMTKFALPPDGYVVLDQARLQSLTNDPKNLIPRTMVFDPDGKPLATIIGYKPLALDRVAKLIGA